MERYRGGLAAGGPLVDSRTFYYAAAEREQAHDYTASDIGPDAASSINAALTTGLAPAIRTRQLTIGPFPTASTETEWSAKLTHRVTAGGALVARLAVTRSHDESDAFNASGLSDRSARGTGSTRDAALTGAWTATLNARTTNEVRAQFAGRRVAWHTTEQEGAGASISGVAAFGAAYVGHRAIDQTYVELGDTVGYSRGTHFLKVGANVRHVEVGGHTADGIGGLYVFRSLDHFRRGVPESTRQISVESSVGLATTRVSAFVQDQWTPVSRVAIDAGARFEASAFPSSLGITNRQVSPRVGIAVTPAERWVLRGGVGVFGDRLPLATVERAWLGRERLVVEHVTDGVEPAGPSIYTARRGAWNPSSRQASLGAEHQLTANATASVTYLFVQGRDLARTVNVNLPPPTILTAANASALGVDAPVPQQFGRPVFGRARLDPSWNGVFEVQPTAASTYHGLTLTLNRRLADEIEWGAAYTWSHARDSASDIDEQPQNPYALGDEWSDSQYDQRHRLVVSALFDLPIGDEEGRTPGQSPRAWVRALSHIEIAPVLTLGSGLPANAITGGDDNRTGAFPLTSRPLNVGRNSSRLPRSATLDVRILKYVTVAPHGKLDFVVEVFNVLNRTNVMQVNPVYGPLLSPLRSFGRPVDAGPARQLQVSIDFEF